MCAHLPRLRALLRLLPMAVDGGTPGKQLWLVGLQNVRCHRHHNEEALESSTQRLPCFHATRYIDACLFELLPSFLQRYSSNALWQLLDLEFRQMPWIHDSPCRRRRRRRRHRHPWRRCLLVSGSRRRISAGASGRRSRGSGAALPRRWHVGQRAPLHLAVRRALRAAAATRCGRVPAHQAGQPSVLQRCQARTVGRDGAHRYR
eukprot:COSAG06_NODE_9684_length_1845_cov_1.203322_3_plen_204_part_00